MPWLWTDTPFVIFGPAHLAALGLTAIVAILWLRSAMHLMAGGRQFGSAEVWRSRFSSA